MKPHLTDSQKALSGKLITSALAAPITNLLIATILNYVYIKSLSNIPADISFGLLMLAEFNFFLALLNFIPSLPFDSGSLLKNLLSDKPELYRYFIYLGNLLAWTIFFYACLEIDAKRHYH